jgi:hypothetical protein
MFCPKCRSEYRAELTHCSDCNVPLVDHLPQQDDVPALVRLRSYSNDGELFLAKSVLESAGIDAMASPPDQPANWPRSFGIGVPATDLYVRAEDAAAANEILVKASHGVGEV